MLNIANFWDLEHTLSSNSPFGATLGMQFKTPTLLLEDIEHYLDLIACFQNQILLLFNSAEALAYADGEFMQADTFLVITSHYSCNKKGERGSHL